MLGQTDVCTYIHMYVCGDGSPKLYDHGHVETKVRVRVTLWSWLYTLGDPWRYISQHS